MTATFAWYRSVYPTLIFWGLACCVWFAAFARGAHDVWAATVLFAGISALTLLFAAGRLIDGQAVRLPLGPPTALLIAACWLSVPRAYDIYTSTLEAWGWTFSALAGFLLLNVLPDENTRDRFFRVTGVILVPLCLIALGEHAIYLPDGYGKWEIHATLVNAAVFAGFCLSWTVYFAADRVFTGRKWLLAFGLLALALSRSLWSFVSLAVGVSVLWHAHIRAFISQRKRLMLFILPACLAVLTAVLYYKLSMRHGPYLGVSRLYYWASSIRMLLEHPLTGVGIGSYGAAYGFFKVGEVQNTFYAHNLIFQLISETGAVGIAAALYWAVALSVQIRRAKTPVVYAAVLTAIFGFSLVTIHFSYLVNQLVLALFVSAAVWQSDAPGIHVRRLWLLPAAAAVIFLAPFWLRLFAADRLYAGAMIAAREGRAEEARRQLRSSISVHPHHGPSYWALAAMALTPQEAAEFRAIAVRKERNIGLERDGVRSGTAPARRRRRF
jgi:O-antigen ligase